MEQTGFIACIDFGTSSITGVLGRRNEQDVISIIAFESISADSCVKHGIVYNIDEAAGKAKKLLSLLENKVGKKIGKVYVSVAGMSLRAVEHIQTQRLAIDTPVTYAMISQLEQQVRGHRPSLLTNYSVVSPEIFLDSLLVDDYLDKSATTIEARYRIIVGRPNIKANLQRAITDKNQIGVAGYVVGPIGTGAIILDEEDKVQGCALVDFGGGTTTVSIYKDGLLRDLVVIPFGGRTITKDIQSLGLSFEAAESYKIRYGRVGKDKSRTDNKTLSDSAINLRELNKIIHLRQDEIVMNVINQITESTYGTDLEAGIVITGAASQMPGLADYLAEKSKMPVKEGKIKRLYINNAVDLLQNPSYTQCLGLMLFAKDDCEKIELPPVPEIKEVPVPKPAPVEVEKEDDHDDSDNQSGGGKSKKNKKEGKQRGLFDFLQNMGGAIFNDEK